MIRDLGFFQKNTDEPMVDNFRDRDERKMFGVIALSGIPLDEPLSTTKKLNSVYFSVGCQRKLNSALN